MKIKVVIHDAEEGGYWAEVPAIPGCATQGETFEELLRNLYEQSKAACRWMSRGPRQRRVASLRSPYEAAIRQGIGETR